MEVCGFAYKVVCAYEPKYTKPTVVYRGENASLKLIEYFMKEQEQIDEIWNHAKPILMTEGDEINAQNATSCCICKKEFSLYDKIYDRPVRHHNHINGSFISKAHSNCNLKCKQTKHTCVIFHNLKNFDAHILCYANI